MELEILDDGEAAEDVEKGKLPESEFNRLVVSCSVELEILDDGEVGEDVK